MSMKVAPIPLFDSDLVVLLETHSAIISRNSFKGSWTSCLLNFMLSTMVSNRLKTWVLTSLSTSPIPYIVSSINLIKGPTVKYHTHDVLIQDIKKLLLKRIFLFVTLINKETNVQISSLNLKPSWMSTSLFMLLLGTHSWSPQHGHHIGAFFLID
jgi:hypothetical protein